MSIRRNYRDQVVEINGQKVKYDYQDKVKSIGGQVEYDYQDRIKKIGGQEVEYDYQDRVKKIPGGYGTIKSLNDGSL